jgi:hypothetical protein
MVRDGNENKVRQALDSFSTTLRAESRPSRAMGHAMTTLAWETQLEVAPTTEVDQATFARP